MAPYLCALFCIVSLCVSMVLHDACVRRTSPLGCDRLRRTGTLLILGIAASMAARVLEVDEFLSMVLVMMVAAAMTSVSLTRTSRGRWGSASSGREEGR